MPRQGEPCGVCGARVVMGEDSGLRRGPEGLARCYEHRGEPAAVEEVPEPVEGRDFVTEVERVFTVHFSLTIRVQGWWDPDADEDKVEVAAWDALRRNEASDGDVEHVESQTTGRTRRVSKGQPFDHEAWLRASGVLPGRRAPVVARGQRCLEA